MIDTDDLVLAIKNLENELNNSGKQDAAKFFGNVMLDLSDASELGKLEELLRVICSSGAITQYADFSFAEESLFDTVYDEAKKLITILEERSYGDIHLLKSSKQTPNQ